MEKATRVNAVRVGSVSINQRRKPCQFELARISKGLTHLLGHPCKYFSRHSWHAARGLVRATLTEPMNLVAMVAVELWWYSIPLVNMLIRVFNTDY